MSNMSVMAKVLRGESLDGVPGTSLHIRFDLA